MMNFYKVVVFFIFIFIHQFSFSGDLFYQEYDWEIDPDFEVTKADSDINAIVLRDLKAIEFFFDEDYDALLQLYTVHSKIQVNSHEAVELYNKHYMPMRRVLGIVDIRARIITEDEVREIAEIDLKDYEGEDEYSSYKYFAFEGVETKVLL